MADTLNFLHPVYLDNAMVASVQAALKAATVNPRFAQFYQQLESSQALVNLENVETLESLKPGMLVELKGQLQRNPLLSTLAAFNQMMSMTGMDLEAPSPTPLKSVSRIAVAQSNTQLSTEETNFFRIFPNLYDELKTAKVQDLVVYHADPELTVCVTLPTASLAPDYQEVLLSGEYRIAGKILRVLKPGETLDLYARTSFNYVQSELFETTFADLIDIPWVRLKTLSASINGPALQILPFAIFV